MDEKQLIKEALAYYYDKLIKDTECLTDIDERYERNDTLLKAERIKAILDNE